MRAPHAVDRQLIVDNGGYELKVGYADTNAPPIVMPNAVMKVKTERKRVYVGGEIDECKDRSALFYMLPMERGFTVNLDTQQKVWDYAFGPKCLNVPCASTSITITEAPMTFQSIRDDVREILFEAYNFAAVRTTTGAALCAASYAKLTPDSQRCVCVVDTGYSFTHIIPFINGRIYWPAVVRVDVGGKLLTNQLKEAISYRQLNVMEDTYVINDCKHDLGHVALDFEKAMKMSMASSSNTRDYILPDFLQRHRGEIRLPGNEAPSSYDQMIRLSHERFAIPELLFRPSNIGIEQMGIAEATAHAIRKCEKHVQDRLYANVVLTGGNCSFPGFYERFTAELISTADPQTPVNVRHINEIHPDISAGIKFPSSLGAWYSAHYLAANNLFQSTIHHDDQNYSTRQEYNEIGQTKARARGL